MIDLVVPYVDFTDINWIKTAKKNNIDYSEIVRFRGQGDFFKYFFRGIDKNLPWINQIFLIVQSKSQVPKWLNLKNIKVVLHEDFIPKQFLPLYNSCTIEMFLGNIKELSEQFLYFNDDMYVLRELTPSDFFEEGKVLINFKNKFPLSFWGNHVKNSYKLIFNDDNELTPWHNVQPLLKSQVNQCFTDFKNQIYESITKLRTTKNMNIYLYTYYLLKNNLCKESKVESGYTSKYDSRILDCFYTKDLLCINDTNPEKSIYENELLNRRFAKHFKEKSKYEI